MNALVFSFCIILSACLSFGPNALAQDGSVAITTEQLLSYLDQVESDQENLRETFEISWYSAHGTAEVPETPDESQFQVSERIKIVVSQVRYRVEIDRFDTSPTFAGSEGRFTLLTWNGEEGRLTTLGAHPNSPKQQGARIENNSVREFRDLPTNHWCGYWGLDHGYFNGYADILRTSEHVRGPYQVIEDGKELSQWRFTTQLAMYGEVLLTAGRIDDKIILHSAEFRAFKSADGRENEVLDDMFLSCKIEYSGELLSKPQLLNEGRYTVRTWPTDENPPRWGLCKIKLISTEKVDPSEVDFLADIDDTAYVADRRYDLAYKRGDRDFNLDGRLYEADIPLEGNVGDRLAWWMERSKLLSDGVKSYNKPGESP